ncbi:MAG: hypothetical protein HS108_13365 [Planctomycetes bacterium]|jgi:hypothetical protein|nr:hypothetical protein [Planctomycetota bacterium]MCL4729468.1 hypothetical protein [Planctomycetota bacterium]
MLDYITQRGALPLTGWTFAGASRDNTDHGRLWVALAHDGGDVTVTLYRDELRLHAVAAGARSGPGPIVLEPAGDSGLSGSVELAAPGEGAAELDVFYACDADLEARHTGLAAHLADGRFAGQPGFSLPCARAKRVLDAMLAARLGPDFRADCLAPLSEAAADYALCFVYQWLSTRPDDPAHELARRFAHSAREALPAIRLRRGAEVVTPFAARVARA